MATIRIPSALHALTGGSSELVVTATTVRDALGELDRKHPGVSAKILDAAGGVGTLIVTAASPARRAELAAHGADTTIVDHGDAREVAFPARPPWWPAADGDDVALAMWRGSAAATRWMTDTIRG